MAEQRGGQGGRGRNQDGRPGAGRPAGGRPGSSGGGRSDSRGSSASGGGRSGGGRPDSRGRGDRDERRTGPGDGDRRSSGPRGEGRGERRGGGPSGGQRGERGFSRPRRDGDDRADRTESQQRYDGPDIPEHITGKELDRSLASQLRSLPDKLALRVARHLVAASELIESDPTTAYQHTLAARARASRLSVVREAVGEAAYAAGEYAEALTELRAAKRMNGVQDYVAIIADCERALGKLDKALATIRNAPREKLAPPLLAELTIVEAGVRRDRGELDAALRTLENAPLMSKARDPWVARLRYAYADALVEAGRTSDAVTWFHRVVAVDHENFTDAAERASTLERELG